MEKAVLQYIVNQIKQQSEHSDRWVLFNGAVIKIVETMWEGNKMLYPDYKCQGTVSEALYHIEQGTLIDFLTAEV